MKKDKRFRVSANAYPSGLRWCIDYSPEFLNKLRDTDEEAWVFLMRFLEAEYGGNAKILYDDVKNQRRCYAQAKGLDDDVMRGVVPGGYVDEMSDALSPSSVEDRLNAAIDGKHILGGLSKALSLPKKTKAQRKQSKIENRLARATAKAHVGDIFGIEKLKKILKTPPK